METPAVTPQLRLALVAMVGAALTGISPASRAACAGPSLSSSELFPRAGESITVGGEGWIVGGCNDDESGGCSAEPSSRPANRIELRLRGPSGTASAKRVDISLIHLDADEEGTFSSELVVPDVPPGRYRLRASTDDGTGPSGPVVITIQSR